jgi:uncharacterized membrane protein YhaH (DUF805 family)
MVKFVRLFDFQSRATRKEYWLFQLVVGFLYIVALIIGSILLIPEMTELFSLIVMIFAFIPSIAVSVRRLHDVGYSGLMLLLYLIPLIGLIWLFILYLIDSEPGENKYGPNPKGIKVEPLTILKTKFAKGKITEEEYIRKKRILKE